LEDNPYRRWNDNLTEGTCEEVDLFIENQEKASERHHLIEKIDAALDANNREAFDDFSKQLLELDKK